jgi:uncharacterized protein YndB with AHSA1/START domain
MANLTATAEIDIAAPAERVWKALTDPAIITRYFFGTQVETDWQPGSPIFWRGTYNGMDYEDRGEILESRPDRLLKVTHFSPMTGLPDIPENYHTLTFGLDEDGGTTHVSLSQDNNADEAEAQRSADNWQVVLRGLKEVVEEG